MRAHTASGRRGLALRESRIVGRSVERDLLGVVVADLRNDRGSLTMISGRPGLGKTALLEELVAQAQAQRVQVRSLRTNDLERTLPLAVLRELLDRPDLDGGWPALYRAALALLEEGPLLLVIDDAQWADTDSLRALVHLAQRVADAPIALVLAHGAAQPAELDLLDRLAGVGGATSIMLAPLAATATAALIRSIVPTAHDELCRRCARAGAGVPLLLVELARLLAVHGPDVLGADGYLQGSLRCEPIERWVRRRMTMLDAPARATVDALAILGGGSAPRIANLAALEPLDVHHARDRLIAAGLLADAGELCFRQPADPPGRRLPAAARRPGARPPARGAACCSPTKRRSTRSPVTCC